MSTVSIERSGAVAIVTFDRPHVRNAMNDAMLLEELPAAIAELRADEQVRAVVLTGAGEAFCSGADLVDNSGWSQADPIASADFVRRTCEPAVRLGQLPQPTVAAVNGVAVGAGFGLAAACDYRFAAPDARARTPFVSFGIVPDFGLTWYLPRIVGQSRALDILLSGRWVDAEEGASMGLYNRVADPVLDAAVEYAETLASLPVAALRATRDHVRSAFDVDLETEVFVHEANAQGVLMQSDEFRERFAAYRETIGSRA